MTLPMKPSRVMKELPAWHNGARACRWCKGPVAPPRRTFCGDECVHEYRLRRDPGYVRLKVQDRDSGVCGACGLDTDRLLEDLHRAKLDGAWRALVPESWGAWSLGRHAWEADHIVPVQEGGGGCGLDGYQTLCIGCHRRKTAEQARRVAEQRRLTRTGQERLFA